MIGGVMRFTAGLLLVVGIVLGLSVVSVQSAGAASPKEQACAGSGGTWVWTDQDNNIGTCTSADNRSVVGTLRRVSEIIIFIVGAIAVLMAIIGGLRYSLAQGDQQAVSAAKNTVLYALVGIIVAFMAYALVSFVAGQL